MKSRFRDACIGMRFIHVARYYEIFPAREDYDQKIDPRNFLIRPRLSCIYVCMYSDYSVVLAPYDETRGNRARE